MLGQNMVTLLGKVALISALGIASMWGDGIISPEEGGDTPCSSSGGDTFACCFHQCRHNAGGACGGGYSCCEDSCR